MIKNIFIILLLFCFKIGQGQILEKTSICKERSTFPTDDRISMPINVNGKPFIQSFFPKYISDIKPQKELPFCKLNYEKILNLDSTIIKEKLHKYDSPNLLIFKGYDNKIHGVIKWGNEIIHFLPNFHIYKNDPQDQRNFFNWVTINNKKLLLVESKLNHIYGIYGTYNSKFNFLNTVSLIDFESKNILIDRLDLAFEFLTEEDFSKKIKDNNSPDDADTKDAVYKSIVYKSEVQNIYKINDLDLEISETRNAASIITDNSLVFYDKNYNKDYGVKKVLEVEIQENANWKPLVLPGKYVLNNDRFILTNAVITQSELEIEKFHQEIKTIIKNLNVEKLQDVLPFKIDNKIGFINAKNKQNVYQPTGDFENITLANPNITGVYKKDYKFNIDSKTFKVNIEKIEKEDFPVPIGIDNPQKEPKIEVIDSKDGYNGFKVDENGKLIAYSSLYFAQNYHHFNVRPFLFKGKYYAIATKKTGPDEYFSGIIDTEGNALPHLNFNVKCLDKLKVEAEDIWFSIGKCRGLNGSLISFKGFMKFENEILSQSAGSVFNYNHSYDKVNEGIFDYEELKWIIKPQSKLDIKNLDYTSQEKLNRTDSKSRQNAKIYFLVKDANTEYYMDFNMQKYFP